MNNRIWVWILLLTLGATWSAPGDDFEDFIQACARVSTNYNRAKISPETRFGKEYQAHLDHLKDLSARIHPVIQKMELGQDLNFPWMATELERIYLKQPEKTQKQTARTQKDVGKLQQYSESPENLLRVLTEDVKALRKMEFTTEDGGSIKSSLETRRKLNEFRRLVNFFRMNYTKIYKNRQKPDFSLGRLFQKRMMRMSALSNLLMETARQKYPDSLSSRNLQTEVLHLTRCMETWKELVDQEARSNKRRDQSVRSENHRTSKKHKSSPKQRSSSRRLDGMNTLSAVRSEISLSLRNINELLVQWEQSGFQSDPPLRHRKNADVSDDPASPLMRESSKKNYESMDQKTLTALLRKRQQAILQSNSSMDGFDRDAERKFLLSLSREQKRSYNDFLRNFQQQGYSSGQSIRSAVLKLHTRIKLEDKPLPVKELIAIMKALDQDEQRSLEKNNLKFKLERGSFEKN